MPFSEQILVAIALAMDAFAVAIASGVALRRVSARQTFRLAWHFGLFQALMPIIGWFMGVKVRPYIAAFDHWLAFALLAYLGGKMIHEAFTDAENKGTTDPTRGMSLVMLSVATSIDAFAVGLSLSLLGLDVWMPALVIGLTAFAFTVLGLHLGRIVGQGRLLSLYAEIIGGLVLIAIGIKILVDHNALWL